MRNFCPPTSPTPERRKLFHRQRYMAPEIRSLVWQELAGAILEEGKPQPYLAMNDRGALCLREDGRQRLIDAVRENGGSLLLDEPIMNAKPTEFREILGEVSSVVVFRFNSTISLANFAERVKTYYGHDPQLMPRLRVELSLFDQQVNIDKQLSLYQPTTRCHGYEEMAYEHVKEKTGVFKTFSNYLDIEIIICQHRHGGLMLYW